MSDVPKDFPRPVAIKRFVQPKLIPQAPGARAIAALHDNLIRWRRKLVFGGVGQVVNILDSQDVVTGDFTAHRFACRTGMLARALVFRLGLARPNWPNGGDDPTPVNPRIVITTVGSSGGTHVYTISAGLGPGGDSTDNPDEWSWPQVICPISAQEDLTVQIELKEGARLFAVSCYEVSTNTVSDIRLNQGDISDGSPILDSQRQVPAENIGFCYLDNATHLVNFTAPSFSTSSRLFNTYANIFDQTLTSVTANTPGFKLETTYHNSVARSTVAVKMAVYASCSSGSGKVRFADSSGTLIEVTGITTLGWYTATGTFPAGTTKADLHLAGSGTASVRVHAVSLFELN